MTKRYAKQTRRKFTPEFKAKVALEAAKDQLTLAPKRVRRMFRLMGHETIYRRKNLTKGALKAYIKP